MGQYTPRYEFIEVQEAGVDTIGKGQYTLHIEVVEVIDSDGQPWEPVPGPDPWDKLATANGATWSDGNDYTVGQSISGVSAIFTGGSPETIYRSRVQNRATSDDPWINTPWTNHVNTPQVISFTIPAGLENGKLRFQTQARDDDGVNPVQQVNSFASIKNITPLQWGVISQTIEGSSYDPDVDGAYPVAINSPIICAVSVANAPTDLSYEWSRRGSDPTLIGTPTAAQTAITFPEQGVFTVTVSLKSNQTADWESAIFTFIAS